LRRGWLSWSPSAIDFKEILPTHLEFCSWPTFGIGGERVVGADSGTMIDRLHDGARSWTDLTLFMDRNRSANCVVAAETVSLLQALGSPQGFRGLCAGRPPVPIQCIVASVGTRAIAARSALPSPS
jgi:hypothetical protein